MKIRFKNRLLITCVSFALCLALFLPAGLQNGGTAKADVEHIIRDYSALTDTDRFMIGGYYGGDAYTEEGISLIQGAGLDFITMFGHHSADYSDWTTPSTKVRTIYDNLHNAGLKVLLAGGRGTVTATTGMQGVKDVGGDINDYSGITPDGTGLGTMHETSLGRSYTDVVLGTELWDEPLLAEIPYIGEYVERYEQAFPDKLFFVNLFPEYYGDFTTNADFNAYIESYCNTVLNNISGRKMLSVDSYPLLQNGRTHAKHFTSMASTAIYAKAVGADLNYYIQTMNPANSSSNYRDLSGQADIEFQYNTAMAFGAKQVINFCYETPTGDFGSDALLDSSGTPTERYTWAKNAADKAHYIGQAYMRFNWNGTIIAKGTTADRFSSRYNGGNDCFASFTNSFYKSNNATSIVPFASTYNSYPTTRSNLTNNNLLSVASSRTGFVGCFTDDAGFNGYMLVNGDDAVSNAATAMNLHFDSSTEKVRIFKGTSYTDETLTNHTLNISLAAGEGAFVVPFKATEVKNVNLVVEGTSNEVVKVEDGGNYVLEDRLSGIDADKAIVGYLYGGNLYPIGYTIENITSDITLTAVYIDLKMEYGASVRMDTDKEHAIRWRAFLDKDDYAAIGSSYNVVGYGFTVMSPDRKGSLTIEVASGAFRDFGEEYRLAGVLTHLSDEELCEEFEARAFVKIRFADGQIKKVHARGNDNLRSIAYVASAAYNDSTASWSAVQMERLRLLAASYEQNDNIGSLDNWFAQVDVDNLGSLDYWLRLIALYG